ncbi:MAG: 4-hydroxythreonine-4-phosphate dehydrogenase PdxA, partial [candidate division Zixibacteria bacterium]|nr:4-hydroxythreonine-4-phosphate dehydrogenase PdxA [candidate division Zixibacteria bacterium]
MTSFLLADDFTGAHDAGLAFARKGLTTVTISDIDRLGDVTADIIVVDTDTRDRSPQEAVRRVAAACKAIRDHGGVLHYKKIDSTIRGPVGQELDAVHEIFGRSITLFVPAFPELGRTIVGGYQLVHGVPVERTAMGDDPGASVRTGFLPVLLGRQSRQAIAHIDLGTVLAGPETLRHRIDEIAHLGNVIVVVDAATRDNLDTILKTAMSMRTIPLLCGSAGMTHGLAEHLATNADHRTPNPVPHRAGPSLTIAGSVHPVTVQQIETVSRRPQTGLYRLDPFALLDKNPATRQAEIDRAVAAGSDTLKTGRDAVIALTPSLRTDRKAWMERLHTAGQGRDLVETLTDDLGSIAERLLDEVSVSGVVLTGGETAEHVALHIGGWGTRLWEAVEDGIARATLIGGRQDGLPIVVKPGAFGGPDTLIAAITALRQSGQAETKERPLLGITIGDPNGVGPEIIAKILAMPDIYAICRPLVIGHAGVMRRDICFAGRPLDVHRVVSPDEGKYCSGTVDVLEVHEIDVEKLIPGTVQAEAGKLAVEAVIAAARLAMTGEIQAIVTAPLNKEAMNLAGYHYAGHTELLADLTETKKYRLTLATDGMLVSHVTTHVSLRQAIERLSEEGILDTVEIIGGALRRMGVRQPRIAVCGLNPHAGEGGMFGDEEIRIITPALEKGRAAGWNLLGPLPPDTVFMRARRGDFDGIVGMYHDQGHIPVKAVAFDRSVNVTLGLPIVRTSVDHGTAFDIAGKGVD